MNDQPRCSFWTCSRKSLLQATLPLPLTPESQSSTCPQLLAGCAGGAAAAFSFSRVFNFFAKTATIFSVRLFLLRLRFLCLSLPLPLSLSDCFCFLSPRAPPPVTALAGFRPPPPLPLPPPLPRPAPR